MNLEIPMMAIGKWKTPVSIIPAQSSGDMHIVKRTISKGAELPLRPNTNAIFTRESELTILREGNKNGTDTESVWMSDTPMEYYMAWDLVSRVVGPRVLVVGLGLGLLVHLLALRRDITHIIVVEKSSDVGKMVTPYLPNSHKPFIPQFTDLRIRTIIDDIFNIYNFIDDIPQVETAIGDIWKDRSEESEETQRDLQLLFEDNFMEAIHLHWAFQEKIEYEEAVSWFFKLLKEDYK
jgi:hypothetical protein